jgi:tRNA pseudouridine38-40 synthase
MSREKDTAATGAARRLALLVEYDGTGFAGSQLQSNARTVQGALEAAILKATESPARAAFAGRTDAGVHALGQVACFTTRSTLDAETMRRALNAWLPADVSVREVAEVAPDFDPRRDARQRRYRYLIENRDSRPALERERVWHVGGALDVDAMSAAAARLVGRHDFAAFASRLEDESASTVREIYCFCVVAGGKRVRLDVTANAFLPHQVRRMTGALVDVGRGRLTPEDYAKLLDGPPGSAGPAAPAHGLYLRGVEYAESPFKLLDSGGGVC